MAVMFLPVLAGCWMIVAAICWCAVVDVSTPEVCRECRQLGWARREYLARIGWTPPPPRPPAVMPDWLLEELAFRGVVLWITALFAVRAAAPTRPTPGLRITDVFEVPPAPVALSDTAEMLAIPI